MKEATGELNMTIVTLVAISAIAALLWFVVWPMIQRMIVRNTCKTYGDDWKEVDGAMMEGVTAGDGQISDWYCCPGGEAGHEDCFGTSIGGGGTTTPAPGA